MKARIALMASDLISLNLFFWLVEAHNWGGHVYQGAFIFNVCYVIAVLAFPPFAQKRLAHAEQIAERAFQTSLVMYFIYVVYVWIDPVIRTNLIRVVSYGVLTFAVFFCSRLLARALLRWARGRGRNTCSVVFVGAGHNLSYLCDCMGSSLSTGYRIVGYFDDQPSTLLPATVSYLGRVEDVIPWLEGRLHSDEPKRFVEHLYCNLPSRRSGEIVQLINYCDKHFVRFFSVPNVRNYVHRSMTVEHIDDMPVLTLRREPLRNGFNRAIKRLFDLVVSSIFLLTCFWWVLAIVALITKLTMPGPIFFRQKRNGLLGGEFYCLKFRSMRVNADADKVQATKNDPRKTRWGNIMRKTNIDELPQFINVFLGQMSVVGPRPHMLKHTEEYGALIEKYMVRHYVKPGVTGWAQVTGARGETEHLWQMEERIRKDIWYIENWSLWLDIRICWLTVWNIFAGDKNAY